MRSRLGNSASSAFDSMAGEVSLWLLVSVELRA